MNTDWQALIDEKIKIQLVAHVTVAGRSLGTISIDPEQPRDKYGRDNVKLELFAGAVSDDEMCVLRQLLETASFCRVRSKPDGGCSVSCSRLREMEFELARIKAYKWCLRDL